MTNLEIIKYLASNNPTRLSELLDDIYCTAWNCGAYATNTSGRISQCEIDDFGEWINQEAETDFFFENELEEWSKDINPIPTVTAFYDGLSVTFPIKDPDYMWNNNNEYAYKMDAVNQAIDEIKLLENLIDSEKIPQSVYDNFRKNVCTYCSDQQNCLRSNMAIFECLKNETLEDWV